MMLITTLVVSFLVCCMLEVMCSQAPATPHNLQHTANQEQNDQCDNQHHSRKLLMMGIIMPETCSAYKKYNKITSGTQLGFYSSVITMMHGPLNIRFEGYVSLPFCMSSSIKQFKACGFRSPFLRLAFLFTLYRVGEKSPYTDQYATII